MGQQICAWMQGQHCGRYVGGDGRLDPRGGGRLSTGGDVRLDPRGANRFNAATNEQKGMMHCLMLTTFTWWCMWSQ
jgi:hypothetical protein